MAKDKDKFINKAQTLIKKGQTDKAIKEYENALQLDKKDVRLYMRLGDIYAKQKDNDKAIDNYLNAAKYLTKDGFYSRAAAVYRQILSVDENRLDIVQQLADLYTKLGLNNEAMAQYQKIATNFEREAKLKEALEVMQKMLDLDPKNVIFATKVAELNYKAGNKEQGYRAFRRALDQLQSEGRYEQYVKLLEKLAKADPDNLDNLKELAQIYVEHEQWDRAFVVLGRIHQNDPENVDVLQQLGNAALKAGRPDDAVKYMKALAGIFKAKGLRQRFKDALRKVLQIHPDDPEARAIVGEHETVLKEHPPEEIEEVIEGPLEVLEEAESAEEVLIDSGPPMDEGPKKALTPDQVMEHLTEAGVYLKYGLRDKALHHVQMVLQADPDNIRAHLALKDIQLEAGKTDLAIKELEWVARNGARQDAEAASLAVQEWLRLEPGNAAAKKLLAEMKAKAPAAAPPEEAEVVHEAEEAEEEEVIEEAAPLEEEEIELEEEEEEVIEPEEAEPAEVMMEDEEEPEPVKAPPKAAARPAPAPKPPARAQAPEAEEMVIEEEVEEIDVEAGAPPPKPPAPQKVAAKPAKPAPVAVEEEVVVEEEEIAEEVEEEEVAARPAAKPKAAAPPKPPPSKPAAPAPARAADFAEDLEEAEFYLQQGLNDEAKKIYLMILHQDPTHEISLKKLKELERGEPEEVVIGQGEEKMPYTEEPAVPPEPPPAAPPPPPKAAAPPPAPKAQPPAPRAVSPPPPPAPAPPPPRAAAPPPPPAATAPPPAPRAAPPPPPAAEAPPAAMQPPAPETSVPEPFADTAAIEPPPGQPVPVPDIAPPPAGPYPQPAAESFDLRAELSDEEPTDKGFFVGPAPAPAAGLFEAGADEGGLFDLAAELEKDEELSASSSHGLGSAAAEFSFEETLSAFKKGVARTISEHDSATHYDLGIAYKEMGLYDEAIQEFLTSSRDPVRYFECMLMSVMIMREKGDLDKALRTCKTALLTPGAKENQMATLYFEMAQAFTAGNDRGRAKWSLEQAKSLHMDHPELDRMIGGLASVPAVPVALDQDVAEVAAAPPAEEPEIDLDKALGLEPEPAPEPGLEASDLGPEPMAQAVTDEPPADAGPFPSREQTSWEKAALEQPPDASEQAQATEQPKKKRKKISYV